MRFATVVMNEIDMADITSRVTDANNNSSMLNIATMEQSDPENPSKESTAVDIAFEAVSLTQS